jgi:hypothetical protein
MSRVVVINNITLDGVMQAPGRPDEDTRDGFEHGGWAVMPNEDPDIGRAMAERMAERGRDRVVLGVSDDEQGGLSSLWKSTLVAALGLKLANAAWKMTLPGPGTS